MTITITVRDFPDIPISKQLFHVPGAALQGGMTSGGAQIITPEPGGFGVLEIQPSLRGDEWREPFISWLMSQGNARVLRVQLTRTPQILTSRALLPDRPVTYAAHKMYSERVVVNDLSSVFAAAALEGTSEVVIDMSSLGNRLRIGHVFGHAYDTYLVDDIEYDGNMATVVSNPPLRRDISVNDTVLFRPYFTGRIGNSAEIISTYDAENAGNIQIGKIVMNEAVV